MQLAPIAFELLEGLGTMHNARVIHRDLKPANVFLSKTSAGRGEVLKILDFGVAKLLPFAGEVGTMTQIGTMMGTPFYMSPEQARGARDVDGRTDIYAASVMFYRSLTGQLPYNADTLQRAALQDRPRGPSAPARDRSRGSTTPSPPSSTGASPATSSTASRPPARTRRQSRHGAGSRVGRASPSRSPFRVSRRGRLPPINAGAESSGSPRPVASAVTNGGTPIAWSEDAPTPGEPRRGSMKSRAAETVMTPVRGGTPAVSSAAVASSEAAAPDEPASAARSRRRLRAPPSHRSSRTRTSSELTDCNAGDGDGRPAPRCAVGAPAPGRRLKPQKTTESAASAVALAGPASAVVAAARAASTAPAAPARPARSARKFRTNID